MHFNVNFDTYRRTLSAGTRTFSGSKTITLGAGYRAPITEALRATLGVEASAEVYILYTEETNILVADKVTISSVDYYVDAVSSQDIGARRLTRAILNKIKA